MSLLGHVSKIVSIILSKLSDCPYTDTSLYQPILITWNILHQIHFSYSVTVFETRSAHVVIPGFSIIVQSVCSNLYTTKKTETSIQEIRIKKQFQMYTTFVIPFYCIFVCAPCVSVLTLQVHC